MNDDDRRLLCGFLQGTLTGEQFPHRAHVRVAWVMLEVVGLVRTLDLYPAALRRLTLVLGVPDRFHATMTCAYLLLVDERRRRMPGGSWEAFSAANADLLCRRPSLLEQVYGPTRLRSNDARDYFVLPSPLSDEVAV